MKAGKLGIQPWLSCQYTENTLMDELCKNMIISLNLFIHETFPYFCYRNMFPSSDKRAANLKFEVSTLLFGYSRRLRHQEKYPNGRWRCESPFGTF